MTSPVASLNTLAYRIAELHAHARNDATGREIRGIAYGAGLPV
jgi:hypothetical protein